MGIRMIAVGIAALVGVGVFFTVRDPQILRNGKASVESAAGAAAGEVKGWVGAMFQAVAPSGANSGVGAQNAKEGPKASRANGTSDDGGPKGGKPGSDPAGRGAAGPGSTGAAGPGSTGAAGPGGSGAGSGAQDAPVTVNNAPPPTPTVIDGIHMEYNPYEPSDGPYPSLADLNHLWIDVSLSQQLVYIFNGDQRLYTMITSSGIGTAPDNSTPLGVFHIQSERGTWFYAQQYQEGGKYWTSWHGHGVFLFHSVPMNKEGQLLPKIAAKLGHPASEGCFHLTIPDAKWFYENIPYRTTVLVEQAPVELRGRTLYNPSVQQEAAEQGLLNLPDSGSGSSSGSQQ